jgi:hypothetical protein
MRGDDLVSPKGIDTQSRVSRSTRTGGEMGDPVSSGRERRSRRVEYGDISIPSSNILLPNRMQLQYIPTVLYCIYTAMTVPH